ncbi:Hypothetical protein FKW44_004258, partial [Caligus rogercresseyi]
PEQWGIGASNPSPLVKIRKRNPSNAILHLGSSGSASHNNGVLGFQTIANCKNTSKEPLKLYLSTLSPRVPPATTIVYWGFKTP